MQLGDDDISQACHALVLHVDAARCEFLVLLPGTTEADMRKKIADIKKKAAMFDNVSFAAGGCFLQPDMDLRDAMSEADAQMYRDKGNFYRKYPELRRD